MAEAARKFAFFKRAESETERERRELLISLDRTKEELEFARIGFNMASDPDLVESSVFEINALQARYNYLLRRIREQNSETSAAAIR
ncbi:YaaL family protein [Oscillospiraceae bacterium OttesenSCG-928-F05]|nr:YaaL family protein [Oscillospiraceae bacterium OttesenSCG-928-F05]